MNTIEKIERALEAGRALMHFLEENNTDLSGTLGEAWGSWDDTPFAAVDFRDPAAREALEEIRRYCVIFDKRDAASRTHQLIAKERADEREACARIADIYGDAEVARRIRARKP